MRGGETGRWRGGGEGEKGEGEGSISLTSQTFSSYESWLVLSKVRVGDGERWGRVDEGQHKTKASTL